MDGDGAMDGDRICRTRSNQSTDHAFDKYKWMDTDIVFIGSARMDGRKIN